MKASSHTLYQGSLVSNALVVDAIKDILSEPYCAYGYQMVTDELRLLGYWINKKKTYRLMDEGNPQIVRICNPDVGRTTRNARSIE